MYNWQLKDWPNFQYNESEYINLDNIFYELLGKSEGILEAFSKPEQADALVNMLCHEAIQTSEIEGEYLSRIELVSSIKKNLGYETAGYFNRDKKAEGIGQLMVASRTNFDQKLDKQLVFDWHQMLMKGSFGIQVGAFRSHQTPMQVISGAIGREVVHFEAPPSDIVETEMNRFFHWYNASFESLDSPLIRSAITHLYFLTIHPFEDGNGRIGRILAEKSLAQSIKRPLLLSLSKVINTNKKDYYKELQKAQQTNHIDDWIKYFAQVIILAQKNTIDEVAFTIKKAKLFDAWNNKINERQRKALAKMLEAGPLFEGGMNIRKYISINSTSKSTATRDLQDLVAKQILMATGNAKNTVYTICF